MSSLALHPPEFLCSVDLFLARFSLHLTLIFLPICRLVESFFELIAIHVIVPWHLALQAPLLQALGAVISLHAFDSFEVEVAIDVRAYGYVGQTASRILVVQELKALELSCRHQFL